MKTSWILDGVGANLKIAMIKSEGDSVTYTEAKMDALEQLRSHVAPYLNRIEELESDEFLITGALPPLKAWVGGRRDGYVISAKTKKRACEIVGQSRHSFNGDWRECEGVWWYHLAHEEAIWAEKRDLNGRGTMTFFKCLTRAESEAILEEHIAPYREMSISRLLQEIDDDRQTVGVTPDGSSYRIATRVRRYSWHPSVIEVECRIDDGTNVIWRPAASIERQIPQFETAGIHDWLKEGF